MAEQFVSTIQPCEEIGMCRDTVNKLRADGVLIPGRDYYRGHDRRSPMMWSKDAVIKALRSRTALAES